MFTFLLSLALSKLGMIGVPLLLCGAAVLLVFRGMEKLAIVAALIAGGWFVSGLVFQEGVASCEARTRAAFEAGVVAQAKANADANDFQRGLVEGLLRGQQELTATLKENDDEAASDPDALHCGLSLGGVQRYEKLRSRAH